MCASRSASRLVHVSTLRQAEAEAAAAEDAAGGLAARIQRQQPVGKGAGRDEFVFDEDDEDDEDDEGEGDADGGDRGGDDVARRRRETGQAAASRDRPLGRGEAAAVRALREAHGASEGAEVRLEGRVTSGSGHHESHRGGRDEVRVRVLAIEGGGGARQRLSLEVHS